MFKNILTFQFSVYESIKAFFFPLGIQQEIKLWRWRQNHVKLEARLSYVVTPCIIPSPFQKQKKYTKFYFSFL